MDQLQSEPNELRQFRHRVFQDPPIEWITVRINRLSDLLEQNATQSASALREVLGPSPLNKKFEYRQAVFHCAQFIEYSCIYELTVRTGRMGQRFRLYCDGGPGRNTGEHF